MTSAPDPQPDPTPTRTSASTFAVLFRLAPYVRPVRAQLIGAGSATMLAMVCGLVIPLVMQRILDGPVATHRLGELPLLIGVVVGLGVLEAAAFFVRRR